MDMVPVLYNIEFGSLFLDILFWSTDFFALFCTNAL